VTKAFPPLTSDHATARIGYILLVGHRWAASMNMKTTLAAVGVVAAILAGLLGGVPYSLHKADEIFSRDERLRQERWAAEQKQALRSGKISSVYFYSTIDTDNLLGEFAGMSEIESLMFELTDLTNKGVETIANLPNVATLTLYGGNPRVGDAGLASLIHCRSLKTLRVINIDVTDDGLSELKSYPGLQELTIYRDPFRPKLLTDEAVKQLVTLKNLRTLNISGGWMSKAALADLKASLPSCHVVETMHWRGR
jgi:hypothetical protein